MSSAYLRLTASVVGLISCTIEQLTLKQPQSATFRIARSEKSNIISNTKIDTMERSLFPGLVPTVMVLLTLDNNGGLLL